MARSRRAPRSPRRGRVQQQPHRSAGRPTGGRTTERLADELCGHALHGLRPAHLVRELAARPDAEAVVRRVLHAAVAGVWERGWQPRDIVHLARKRSARQAAFATAAIAAQCSDYLADPAVDPEWRAQLADLGAIDAEGRPAPRASHPWRFDHVEPLDAAFELLGWLGRLGSIPPISGRPGAWQWHRPSSPRRRSSDPIIDKVRALLAKAESTDFPEEAEAFSAKAQELITRHAIDRALVDARAPADEAPIARRVPVDDPHAQAKVHLLSEVALANRCQVVWADAYGIATIVGFADDIESIELLFASLLVQASRTLAAIARTSPPGAHERSTRFRRGFLHGYASEIGTRLRDAAAHSTARASDEHGDGLLPVLARRDEAVSATLDELFPHAVTRRTRLPDYAGWVAGSAAGRVASLGLDGAVAPHLPS